VRLASLFGSTVIGIVYSTVLAKVHEPHGWREASTNNVFHYVVPIMMALGWLLFGPRPRIEVRTIALAMLWPVAWIVYILIYGAITKWYPYPFLDVTTHGYGRVIVNNVAVVAVLFVVTGLYWLGDRRLPATDRTADKAAHRTRQADRRTSEPSGLKRVGMPPDQPVPVERPGGVRIHDRSELSGRDLVIVEGLGGAQIRLHYLAATYWFRLVAAAPSDGLGDPLLLPVSGFRSLGRRNS
jgi:hypothetical protein